MTNRIPPQQLSYEQALARIDAAWERDGAQVMARALSVGGSDGAALLQLDGQAIAAWLRGVARELGIAI